MRIRGLVKDYPLGHQLDFSLKSLVIRKLKGIRPEILHVLKGVDLDIPRGQAVGICGANGAGKSTLLKIISGIVPPTSGTVEVKGRVASLLELGAGFHPEMTGEENVLLNGVILGIPEKELRNKMAAIFRTAGLQRFKTTPVKNYSSGMVQRLGFSIAAHLNPDILILDEVFAVGDLAFQEIAWNLFYGFKVQKKTIILVSHDLSILEKFCDRVIMIASGDVLMDGPPKVVTHQYAILSWHHRVEVGSGEIPYKVSNRIGDQRMRLESIELLDEEGNETRAFRQFSPMRVRLTILSEDEDLGYPFISVKVQDAWSKGICTAALPPPESYGYSPPRFQAELVFDQLLLYPGHYSLEVLIRTRGGWLLDGSTFAESFAVIPPQETERYDILLDGYFHHPARWEAERKER